MAKPVKPVAPPPALRSQPGTFSARFEDWILYTLGTLPEYADLVATFVDERANEALAAAIGGDLPPLAGQGGRALFIKLDETGAELLNAVSARVRLGLQSASSAGGTQTLEINRNGNGNRFSVLDFISTDAPVDGYSARIVRNNAVNGNLGIIQTGTAPIQISSPGGVTINGETIPQIIAALTPGAVGSYTFAYSSAGDTAVGGLVAGNTLTATSAAYRARNINSNGLDGQGGFTGQWMAMGRFDQSVSGTVSGSTTVILDGATLWKRVF